MHELSSWMLAMIRDGVELPESAGFMEIARKMYEEETGKDYYSISAPRMKRAHGEKRTVNVEVNTKEFSDWLNMEFDICDNALDMEEEDGKE